MRSYSVLVLISVTLSASHALNLPTYLKQCSRSDNQLNDCVVKNANLGIEPILQGDKKYKIPKLVPLKIDEVKIDPGSNFKFIMRKIKVYGLENAKVTDADVNLNTLKMQLKVIIPKVTLIGEYEVHGRILVLPIEGTGPANITLENGEFTYKMELETFDQNGETYARVNNHRIDMVAPKTSYQLDNLFNGNRELSDQMNKFLNENHREVGRDIGPAVSETISVVITSIIAAVLKVVPWDNVFLP